MKYGTEHFNFLAPSLTLPTEKKLLMEMMMREDENSFWIIKPPGKNNGQGIRLINNHRDIPDGDSFVQRYIRNPFLIEGKKFDLRVYVLVTGVDPLRIYVYNEGLVRFATEDYTNDPRLIGDARIHVTNYDVNKDSDKFVVNDRPEEPEGHKWT